MNKEEFKRTFDRALTIAAETAERQLDRPVPRTFEIELHGLAPSPRNMSADDALDVLYLGPKQFYRIIDVSVTRVSKDVSTVFVCISGHALGSWDETWNQPPGNGPFKQLVASEIESID